MSSILDVKKKNLSIESGNKGRNKILSISPPNDLTLESIFNKLKNNLI